MFVIYTFEFNNVGTICLIFKNTFASKMCKYSKNDIHVLTPGIRPNASGAATVSPDGKQVGKNFITNLIIIIKVCYLLYFW